MPRQRSSFSTKPDPRIFLSYARKDGEDFARDLRQKLIKEKFSLWQDRTQMEGGKDWWDQITESLKTVEYMVLVMTEAALASSIVKKEWRQARQEGVGVIPVFGQPNLDLSQLPRWMREVHWVNTEVPEQWTLFIRTLESPHQGTRVPFMADDLPVDYVPRLKEFEELAGSLLDPQQEEPIAITAALKGAGGYGKTTLAKALCHDERIQDVFHDGILWVTLGEDPDIMAGVTKLYAALTEDRPSFVDQEDASNRLAEVLGGKDCVMVIDDVWNAAHVTPFLRGGKRCARIITTRDSGTLPPSAKLRVDVDAMRLREAVALLAFELPEEEKAALEALAEDLGEWPFLLKLVNATLRDRVNAMGQALPDALTYVHKALEKRGLTAFDARNPVERNQAVTVTLGASFEHLKKDELALYQELVIFPEDVAIPLTAITKLWGVTGGLDDFDTEELCTRLSQLSLVLRYDLTTQQIQLHDVVRTYLEEQCAGRQAQLNRMLIDSYDLKGEPAKAAQDPYLCCYLAYHYVKAGRWDDFKRILLNVDWLYAKLEASDVPALLSDFDWLEGDKTLVLVQGAIRLSAHILGKSQVQVVGQLVGRLKSLELDEIQRLLEYAKNWKRKPWLRPLQGSLMPPGGPLVRTLSGHSGSVRAVAVTPDGVQAISAADDGTLKVWNLESGQEVCELSGSLDSVLGVIVVLNDGRAISGADDGTLKVWDFTSGQEIYTFSGHTHAVTEITVTPNNMLAISVGADASLKVWDLVTGHEQHTLKWHSGWVNAVTVTPDGVRAILATNSETLNVWDLQGEYIIQTLRGHRGWVNTVTVTPDGKRAISAAGDQTLKVWDLNSGREIHTLRGHRNWVNAVTVMTDGARAISAAADATLKVWNLENGLEIHTLLGHRGSVNAVLVTADGTRAVSVGEDDMPKVWDLTNGKEIHSLNGHHGSVNAVIITPNGKGAITAASDHTLKVWDLTGEPEAQSLNGHRGCVTAIKVTPDATRAISAGEDYMLYVWDLARGDVMNILKGHLGEVRDVSITPDSTRVLSVSDDGMLKVWDLTNGQEVYTFRGHRDMVNDVAVVPDGMCVVSAANDDTLKIWSLVNGKELKTLSGHLDLVSSVTVTVDGKKVISAAADDMLKVWDLGSGKEVYSLNCHRDSVNAVTVAPDNIHVITAGADCTLKVWDLMSGREVATFTGESAMSCCAVSVDGRTIGVGESSGRVHILRLEGVD